MVELDVASGNVVVQEGAAHTRHAPATTTHHFDCVLDMLGSQEEVYAR